MALGLWFFDVHWNCPSGLTVLGQFWTALPLCSWAVRTGWCHARASPFGIRLLLTVFRSVVSLTFCLPNLSISERSEVKISLYNSGFVNFSYFVNSLLHILNYIIRCIKILSHPIFLANSIFYRFAVTLFIFNTLFCLILILLHQPFFRTVYVLSLYFSLSCDFCLRVVCNVLNNIAGLLF